MSENATTVLITLVVYKLVLIGIGFWAQRRNVSESDFFLGGQTLGPWVAGLSYAATSSSAWVLLGYSGFVYAAGPSAMWMLPGIWLGYVLVWVGFGRQLREQTEAKGLVTPTDFLAADASAGMRKPIVLTASALIVFCFLFYVAAQFQAAGTALATTFSLNGAEAVVLGATVVLIYCLLGGFWAVSVTDTLQGFVMGVVALATPIAAVVVLGGPAEALAAIRATAGPEYLDIFGGRTGFAFLGFAVGLSSIGLGTAGQPQLLARVMSVRSDSARRQAFAIALGWAVTVFLCMSVVGLTGRALAAGLANSETLLFELVGQLFPSVLAGIALAALLSAVMSTVDSILLSASGAVAHDMGLNYRFKGRELLVSRLTMTSITVLAVLLTLTIEATIFDRVLFAWAALGAAFGPIIVARVLGWKPRDAVVLASMLIGFSITVYFSQAEVDSGPGGLWERGLPWVPTLLLLYLGRQPRSAAAPEAV